MCRSEPNVAAPFQFKSTRFFTTKAKCQETAGVGKPNRTYHAAGPRSLLVAVFQNNDDMIGIAHGAAKQVFHFGGFNHGISVVFR